MSIRLPKWAKRLWEKVRYIVLYGGRGGAKSHAVAEYLIIEGMSQPTRILCARELQVSISDSVHKLLSDKIASNPDYEAFYDVLQTTIRGKNGTEFIFKGLKHNANEIKSFEGADICWVEEGQAVSDKSWELLIPTIRKEGSKIIVTFNPKNPSDPTYTRFVSNPPPDSIVLKVNWRDNPFFPDVLNKERLHMLETDPEAYEHVWEGNFDTRYSGAVYAKWVAKLQEQGRISDRVKHDPDYPVYTAWDLGYDDATAIWFYQIGSGQIFIIDYYEANHEDIKHYAEVCYGKKIVVDERDKETGDIVKWRFDGDLEEHKHRQAYNYHADYGPHDAAYKIQAAGGRSILSQLSKLGRTMYSIPATTQQQSIEALRQTLPRCWFNSERCKDGIAALMHYHFEYDEDKKVFKSKPNHDWSSHASDAAEIMGRTWTERVITTKELDRKALVADFHRKRAENNLVQEDPYRVKK